MPVHPISQKRRKAENNVLYEEIEDPEERAKVLGSPYAVSDYYSINPDLGTSEDFTALINDIHAKGMRVIIDWVPNHTGWDHNWIEEHPEWYSKDKNGKITDPINPESGESWGWTDVADLNYDNEDMRQAMIDAMKYWVEEYNIDGFRVDVAHGVPVDFWVKVKDELTKSNNELFMLAESEVPSHRNSGVFHATYGWSFHHLLNEVAQGDKGALDIKKWLKNDAHKYTQGFHIHFTSNHDENSWAGTVFERMGDAHQAMAVVAATLDGMPLIYSGQEEPLRRRLKFFKKDNIFFSQYEYANFYRALSDLKEENRALWNGSFGGEVRFLTDHPKVLAFQREKNGDDVIVIVNLSGEEQTFTMDIEYENRPDIFRGLLMDYVKGEKFEISPWRYYVLR
jgi:glycosidase